MSNTTETAPFLIRLNPYVNPHQVPGDPDPETPTIEPLVAQRSVQFSDRNGLNDYRHWLAGPAWSNLFRTGSSRANGVLGIMVQMDQSGLRGTGGSAQTTDQRSGQNTIIATGTTDAAGTHYLGYYGAVHSNTSRRRRFWWRATAPGPSTVEALSEEWELEEPVLVLCIVEGTNMRVDLVRMNGTVLTGANTDVSTWNGVPSPNAFRLGSDTRAGADSLFSSLKAGALSNYFYARRAPSSGDVAALVAGDSPATVFGADLDHWYRLNGPGDLAQTGGSASLAALTLGNIGGVNVRAGPSLWPVRSSGTSIFARVHNDGYVAGFARGGPYTAPIPVYVTNTAGAATHVEASACLYIDGETRWTPWTRITSSPLGAGATELLDVPAVPFSDWLSIEVRREDNTAVRSATARCGVGPKVMLADGQSTAEIPFGTMGDITDAAWATVTETDALVSASMNMFRIGVPGNTVHAVLEDRRQLGAGAHGFGKAWRQLCTYLGVRRVAHIMNTAVSGEARHRWYLNNTLAGSYLFTGDWTTAGSGRVTDVLLRSCARTTHRDITAFFIKPGSSDLGNATEMRVRYESWYLGTDMTGDGFGNTGTPPRHYGQANLAFTPHILFVLTPRYLGVAADNDSAAEQAATATIVNNWRNNMKTFFDATSLSKGWATFSNDLAFNETGTSDKVHHDHRLAAGTGRFYGRMAWDVARLANLLPSYQPKADPPSTFNINGARNTITVTLPATPNGGTWNTGDGAPTVGGMEISTDGGSNWEMIDGTLSGGTTITYTGDWSAVSDANLRMRYLRGRFPAVVAASTSNPDLLAANTAENLLLPRHVYEQVSWTSGAWLVGVPLWRSEANMVPA